MRGQVSLEYIVIFAFSLIAVGILWSYTSTNIEDARWDLQVSYAKSAMSKIAETTELTYFQGPPSKFYIYPTFPDNVKQVYINQHSITFELKWKFGFPRNITVETIANLTGGLSTAAGTHKVLVQSVDGIVNITEV